MQIQKARQGYKIVKSYFGRFEEIPESWSRKSLNEIGELSAGGTPSTFNKDYWYDGTIPWISSGEVKNNRINDSEKKITEFGLKNSAAKMFPSGTVLVAITGFGMTRGRTSILEIDASTNQSVIGIITKDEVANNEFVWFALQKQYQTLRNFAQGTQQPGLNLDILEKFRLFLPNNVNEQQKIASILSNVESLINQTQKEIGKTQRFKKGLMQKLLTKGIGHTKFKNIFLKYHFLKFSIPETWEIKTVKQLSTLKKGGVITGPFGLMLHSSDYVSKGTPLILIKNIQNGKIVEDDIPKISPKDVARLSRYKVKEGDMIFSRVGRVGSSVLIQKSHEGWLFSGQTLRIRFDNPELNSEYVNYYFHSKIFSRVLIPELLGATRDSINTTILENFPIIVPPKMEQDKIVMILTKTDSQIQKQQEYKSNLESLKKGLMQKLLTGQMRVKV